MHHTHHAGGVREYALCVHVLFEDAGEELVDVPGIYRVTRRLGLHHLEHASLPATGRGGWKATRVVCNKQTAGIPQEANVKTSADRTERPKAWTSSPCSGTRVRPAKLERDLRLRRLQRVIAGTCATSVMKHEPADITPNDERDRSCHRRMLADARTGGSQALSSDSIGCTQGTAATDP